MSCLCVKDAKLKSIYHTRNSFWRFDIKMYKATERKKMICYGPFRRLWCKVDNLFFLILAKNYYLFIQSKINMVSCQNNVYTQTKNIQTMARLSNELGLSKCACCYHVLSSNVLELIN